MASPSSSASGTYMRARACASHRNTERQPITHSRSLHVAEYGCLFLCQQVRIENPTKDGLTDYDSSRRKKGIVSLVF